MKSTTAKQALVLALTCAATLAHAQEASRPGLLAEGYLALGSFPTMSLEVGLNDWRALLPGSTLLAQDLSGFSRSVYYGGGYWGTSAYRSSGNARFNEGASTGSGFVGFGLDLGRNTAPGSHFEQRLRVGANIIGSEELYGNWSRKLVGRYDTLVSQQTGQMTFLDTTWAEGYSSYTHRSRAALDVSYVIRRASASRWSWHAGLGMLAGMTHSGRAETEHYSERYRQGYGSQYSNYERAVIKEESFRLKNTFFSAAYATLGIDLRLGRTNPFWSQLHLFAELRPMLFRTAYSGLPARIVSSAQSLFGLRIDLR